MGKRKLSKESPGKPVARNKSPWMFWGISGAVAAVAVGLIVYLALDAGGAPEIKAGKQAPDFALKLMSGQSVSLSSLKGKPVLVNFWASG
jgi:cytochrome oxidase Cu insertion factor (SCO1/SenC/PrrC family)